MKNKNDDRPLDADGDLIPGTGDGKTRGQLMSYRLGLCPLRNFKSCDEGCELFSREAPTDITRHEYAQLGIEYIGMCSFRLMAEAYAAIGRSQSSF